MSAPPRSGPPAWVRDAVFLHVYPLGACGAPPRNDFQGPPAARLDALLPWVDAWAELGANAVYLGPVFESSSHGYDTADYRRVDRRLGDEAALARLTDTLHRRGLHVVLDAVFNHVGRDFGPFRDVREKGDASPYAGWFAELRFGRTNRFGDPFVYEGWHGVDSLVKLDLGHEEVRRHLFDAVALWVERFGIDGLRLDAADAMDLRFFDALAAFCGGLDRELWLMGEVIHGDYRNWARPGRLHATTDYALWKALWSSHNDRNYFELAHTLQRQVAASGMYAGLDLYTFADNHDVHRAASLLTEERHLPLLYLLLFTLPGIPSIYYGSEWGQRGRKQGADDAPLRPPLPAPPMPPDAPHPGLREVVRRLAALRHARPVLRRGGYRELLVRSEQLAFAREDGPDRVVVVANAAREPAELDVPVGHAPDGEWVDLLDPGTVFPLMGGRLRVTVPPSSGRLLEPV